MRHPYGAMQLSSQLMSHVHRRDLWDSRQTSRVQHQAPSPMDTPWQRQRSSSSGTSSPTNHSVKLTGTPLASLMPAYLLPHRQQDSVHRTTGLTHQVPHGEGWRQMGSVAAMGRARPWLPGPRRPSPSAAASWAASYQASVAWCRLSWPGTCLASTRAAGVCWQGSGHGWAVPASAGYLSTLVQGDGRTSRPGLCCLAAPSYPSPRRPRPHRSPPLDN